MCKFSLSFFTSSFLNIRFYGNFIVCFTCNSLDFSQRIRKWRHGPGVLWSKLWIFFFVQHFINFIDISCYYSVCCICILSTCVSAAVCSPRVDCSSRSVGTVIYQSDGQVELHWRSWSHCQRASHRVSGQLGDRAEQQPLRSSLYYSGETQNTTEKDSCKSLLLIPTLALG